MAIQIRDKEAYKAKVKAEVDKINAQIDELNAKANQAKADAVLEYYSQMEELEAKKNAVNIKLQEMQQSSEDAWQELQVGFEKAWNELTTAFERASSRF
ncbi:MULTISPECIES: hypothetical protein [Spirulina sp. CCY15215]|uniref:hypothetical protein n=1 Tax=Spirulina sp. CCY15215 TaxID=2767591 RepID=UPI00195227ED|nr:hypothetical protein [Spirulina major]